MKLLIDYRPLQIFKRKASKAYPCEIFAILLGKSVYDKRIMTFRIDQIVIPSIVESTNEYVIPDYSDIDRIVSESHLDYIGSIHTHPNAAPTLSAHDWKYWEKNEIIIGILSIRKQRGRKITELKFWAKETSCPVKFKVIKNV
jgi:proteasome lid subunit RPN8/RPN11